jgi:dienelactone hydrolase
MFVMPTPASPGRRAARHRPAGLLLVATTVAFACAPAPRGLAQDARPPDSQATPAAALAADVLPLWRRLFTPEPFAIRGRLALSGDSDEITIRFARFDEQSFDLEVTHEKYAAVIRRRADATALALPKHRIVHFGRGGVDAADHLAPRGSFERLVSAASAAAVVLPFLAQESPAAWCAVATGVLGVRHDPATGRWRRGDDAWLERGAEGRFALAAGKARLALEIEPPGAAAAVDDFPGYERSDVPRDEIERQLARGARRALEILLPGPALTAPEEVARSVEHGSLAWVGGLRLVTLHGTPEEMGRAHGELLGQEARRCLDSVLHVVGTYETIRGGTWFRRRLDDAAARLAPHIPERHARETAALARSLGLDPALMAAVNVFPELFHCSGYAVFGSATADGTLYHGRVLDYMTEIGLQDAATAFVVVPTDGIPFVSVGYAGFTGSVSGMNARGISLGEMGGGGEGRWDGVPMATLMRRALEECTTLDEVVDLWRRSPRTCEYYYVFADGKSRSAVGVAATPEALEVVGPGEAHPRLGDGIADAVVLSAGDRLACLRGRVLAGHGRIDERAAIDLMDRPVAMRSNLHNVLFVPERLVLHVAHASHTRPAAEQPAVRLDFAKLLAEVPREKARAAAHGAAAAGVFAAADSLAPGHDPRPDARACLAGLVWDRGRFAVAVEKPADDGEPMVSFPSPLDDGPDHNDTVWMEWHRARDAAGDPVADRRPACVVVHESGSGMQVGRLVARGLAAHGVHGFLVHLPYYGRRRPPTGKPQAADLVPAIRQAVVDVRRARDAAAALPGVDFGRIALQGTSLGGFVAATAGGLDRGFHRTFVMLAGGDIAGVVEGGRREAAELREKLARSGMTADDVRRTFLAIEPLRLAHRHLPDRTWIYAASFDDVVPPAHARRLAEAAGLAPEHLVELYANHYSGIIYLPALLAQVRDRIVAE